MAWYKPILKIESKRVPFHNPSVHSVILLREVVFVTCIIETESVITSMIMSIFAVICLIKPANSPGIPGEAMVPMAQWTDLM